MGSHYLVRPEPPGEPERPVRISSAAQSHCSNRSCVHLNRPRPCLRVVEQASPHASREPPQPPEACCYFSDEPPDRVHPQGWPDRTIFHQHISHTRRIGCVRGVQIRRGGLSLGDVQVVQESAPARREVHFGTHKPKTTDLNGRLLPSEIVEHYSDTSETISETPLPLCSTCVLL